MRLFPATELVAGCGLRPDQICAASVTADARSCGLVSLVPLGPSLGNRLTPHSVSGVHFRPASHIGSADFTPHLHNAVAALHRPSAGRGRT